MGGRPRGSSSWYDITLVHPSPQVLASLSLSHSLCTHHFTCAATIPMAMGMVFGHVRCACPPKSRCAGYTQKARGAWWCSQALSGTETAHITANSSIPTVPRQHRRPSPAMSALERRRSRSMQGPGSEGAQTPTARRNRGSGLWGAWWGGASRQGVGERLPTRQAATTLGQWTSKRLLRRPSDPPRLESRVRWRERPTGPPPRPISHMPSSRASHAFAVAREAQACQGGLSSTQYSAKRRVGRLQ